MACAVAGSSSDPIDGCASPCCRQEGDEVRVRERRYDIDWWRAVATVAVFLFHCTRIFDTEGWHLKNDNQSEFLFVLMRCLMGPWLMELFFVIAGVGAWHSLASRRPGAYLWERASRLLIPLYTVGLFALLPVQYYFDIRTRAGYREKFWRSVPACFADIDPPQLTAWPETLLPVVFPGHLWFLQYLFLISLTILPLLLYLRSVRGRALIAKVAQACDRHGGVLLFVIPLAIALIGVRGLFEARRSWPDFVWYGIYFVIGYVLAADGRFTGSVVRHGWVCLSLWILGFFGGVGLLVRAMGYDPFPGREVFSLAYVVYQIVWAVTSWSAVVFILSVGAKYLNRNHAALGWMTEAALPFYLLHQTVILAVGFLVARWNLEALPKLVLVVTISLPVVVIVCESLVRPVPAGRRLFGLKPQVGPGAGTWPFVGQRLGLGEQRGPASAACDEPLRL